MDILSGTKFEEKTDLEFRKSRPISFVGKVSKQMAKYRLDSLEMKEWSGTLDLRVFRVKLSHVILLAPRILM